MGMDVLVSSYLPFFHVFQNRSESVFRVDKLITYLRVWDSLYGVQLHVFFGNSLIAHREDVY